MVGIQSPDPITIHDPPLSEPFVPLIRVRYTLRIYLIIEDENGKDRNKYLKIQFQLFKAILFDIDCKTYINFAGRAVPFRAVKELFLTVKSLNQTG